MDYNTAITTLRRNEYLYHSWLIRGPLFRESQIDACMAASLDCYIIKAFMSRERSRTTPGAVRALRAPAAGRCRGWHSR